MHKLIFTEDVLGRDSSSLLSLLSTEGTAAKVQVWIDDSLVKTQAEICDKVSALLRAAGSNVSLAGVFVVPGGEQVKNDWRHVELILEAINSADLDRRSYIVVIGGGAVLDAVGFAAATAHRGIRLIRLPTTTLAQADSGVGVKNAVNRFGKKNWLGTFAVPYAVINDAALLTSLPARHFAAGFSEAVKVTLLKSPEGFRSIREAAVKLSAREPSACQAALSMSARLHLDHIVAGGDPFEAREARPLDFGHWSAHKLEALSNFQIPHGEAVGIGVALDTVYSSLVFGLPAEVRSHVIEIFQTLAIPIFHDLLTVPGDLFRGLEEFRQHLGGRLTLTMLRNLGEPFEVHEIDYGAMVESINLLASCARQSGQPLQARAA